MPNYNDDENVRTDVVSDDYKEDIGNSDNQYDDRVPGHHRGQSKDDSNDPAFSTILLKNVLLTSMAYPTMVDRMALPMTTLNTPPPTPPHPVSNKNRIDIPHRIINKTYHRLQAFHCCTLFYSCNIELIHSTHCMIDRSPCLPQACHRCTVLHSCQINLGRIYCCMIDQYHYQLWACHHCTLLHYNHIELACSVD